ncbi:MAG: DUF1127 domain-containing protein [Rhodospirillales bacterium]
MTALHQHHTPDHTGFMSIIESVTRPVLNRVESALAHRREERKVRKAVEELSLFSDRELHDLSVTRTGIEHAVRNGLW